MNAAIGKAAKAILGAAIAGLGALAVPLVGDAGFGDLTAGQWVTVLLTTLVTFGGVYGIKNQT